MDMNPAPPKLELVEVLLLDIIFNNGRGLDLVVRAGDSLTETPDTLTFIHGTTGQTVAIARSQIAVLSKLTRMVPKDPKPFTPAADPAVTKQP